MAKKTRTSTKSKSNKKAAARSNKKAAARPAPLDQPLRDHLLYLLKGGGAHANFDDAMGDWPVQLAGVKVANFPHTAWMLLEHLRLGQWDIVEFSRNSKHVSPKWPEGYWPPRKLLRTRKHGARVWLRSGRTCGRWRQLVADRKVDLYARIPWGDGQTILREALLVADHNAYHLGQLVMLRKSIGI